MWRVAVAIFWVLRRLGLVDIESVHRLPKSIRAQLHEAKAVELFSLGEMNTKNKAFFGAEIIGSVVIENQRERNRLLERILIANRFNIGGFMCLGAEYGLRVQTKEKIFRPSYGVHQ